MSKISLFPNGYYSEKKGQYVPSKNPSAEIEFEEYLNCIQSGVWQDEVLKYRTKQIDKNQLKGVCPSGTFLSRKASDMKNHSGFIAIDVDEKDQTEKISVIKDVIQKDAYTYASHHSVSGYGLVLYVKIDASNHLESFLGIEKYLLDNYKIIIDKSCKDVSRYRFVSYDPDLFLNKKAKIFKQYLKKAQIQPKKTFIHNESDVDFVLNQISLKGVDLTNSYHDWINIGFALISKYGTNARDKFHIISQNSHKYSIEETDKVFEILSKRNAHGITISTFFWLAQNAGLEIKTDKTKYVEKVSKQRRRSVGKNGGIKSIEEAFNQTKKYLKEIDNIEDADDIITQVMQLSEDEIKADKEDNELESLKIFIKSLGIRFNQVTRYNERENKQLTDRDLNTIYLQSLEQVSEKIKKDQLFTLLDSELIEEFNPFFEFFEKNKHLQPQGNFEKLKECIEYSQFVVEDNSDTEIKAVHYLDIYLKKWLLSVIASMHGTYSLMILVLTGKQGNGKTNFFRGLLPEELQQYYAESKLDEGKDSEILMTKKILILDDEFGGKSKQDVKRLKELSSKQTFNIRRPYGRTSEDLQRLAVLCGTSNEEEVINDPTGNRRIIPLNLLNLDIEKFNEIDKKELWIELYHEWQNNKKGWMLDAFDIEFLNKSTFDNEQKSIEEELVLRYFQSTNIYAGNAIYMTNTDIASYLQLKTNLRITQTKLGLVLKKLKYTKKTIKKNGLPCKVYIVIKLDNE
jgi:hypothetical protein